MLGGGGEIPSRYELLCMVKKHSKLLGKTVVDEHDTLDVEIDACFWQDVLDLYFIQNRKSKGCEGDDLIFFVRKLCLYGYGFNDNMGSLPPYFVRRWESKVVGENSKHVDWRRSFYLNLIAHTSFTLTVAICSRQVLKNYRDTREAPLSPIYKFVKTVYASPSRINFHLDSRKEVETIPAYPEICFAVDDFDSTIGEVVLTETDHCYCVLLNAHDGAAFPNKRETNDSSTSSVSFLKIDPDSQSTESNQITLFSGFVSYQMVREAYDAGKSRFGSLLSLSYPYDKTDKLYMRGPGGCGEVEVAVSGVSDERHEEWRGDNCETSKSGIGISRMVHRAVSVASVAAKQAFVAAGAGWGCDEQILPLRCCIMSISLPWDHIASDLLFKGCPAVKM